MFHKNQEFPFQCLWLLYKNYHRSCPSTLKLTIFKLIFNSQKAFERQDKSHVLGKKCFLGKYVGISTYHVFSHSFTSGSGGNPLKTSKTGRLCEAAWVRSVWRSTEQYQLERRSGAESQASGERRPSGRTPPHSTVTSSSRLQFKELSRTPSSSTTSSSSRRSWSPPLLNQESAAAWKRPHGKFQIKLFHRKSAVLFLSLSL